MPKLNLEDTIAAIATPIGEGGISVIRVSGPDAFKIIGQIFYPKKLGDLASYSSHTIHLGEIRNEQSEVIDQVLVSLFRAPHSYTGEDVIEVSSHGGLAVTKHILDLLIQKGARHAEPGEFTKRAFLNGKIDLTQAEAVLDLIKAKSERSLEIAARQLAGSLSQKFKSLKDELMQLYAHLEAYLDFPDEHLELYSDQDFADRFARLRSGMEKLIASFKRGSILREGVMIAIVGKPNVGKSSLFNALLERDRALVSEFPGTTRDQLEESIEIGGVYVRLVDTAGLASSADHPLDRMGMERTRQTLQESPFFLYMVDGSAPLEESDRVVFEELNKALTNEEGVRKFLLVLVNKCDLSQNLRLNELVDLTSASEVLKISTKTREGLDQLEKRITDLIVDANSAEGEQITRLRHKNELERALEALCRAEAAFHEKLSLEFVALDLKEAIDHLRELIGEVYSEDLLDVIFAEFCIGK